MKIKSLMDIAKILEGYQNYLESRFDDFEHDCGYNDGWISARLELVSEQLSFIGRIEEFDRPFAEFLERESSHKVTQDDECGDL